MNAVKNLLIFLSGVGVGAAGTYFILNERFNKTLDEEVEKVKHYYDAPKEEEEPEDEIDIPEVEPEQEPDDREVQGPEKPALFDYAKISKAKHKETEPVDIPKPNTGFRLISPDRFEDLSYEYQTQDLIAYQDGFITDIQDNVLYESFDSFVKDLTPDDFDNNGYLYVADDNISRLYEVSLDGRNYSDVFELEE